MSKNKNNKIRVKFIGKNADDVTGSMILIEMQNYKILLECGLYQSNNIKEDYLINSRKFEFKPSEIDYIFIGHSHIDHIGLLPRLYANGCKAKVIVPQGISELFSLMAKDSAFIIGKDVETLQRKYALTVQPIYTAEDVETSLQYFEEYNSENIIKLNDSISFKFISSGHIINAMQIELFLTEGNHTSKILYTSDLGSVSIPKFYSGKFKPSLSANLVIGEATYSKKGKSTTNKDREKDLEKIKTVITNSCLDHKSSVLIPIFALDRCQNILTHLYNMFGKDPEFTIPIIVDSPLAVKITKLYQKLLIGDDLEQFEKVMSWSNIHLVEDYELSKFWMSKKEPKLILSASGMMQAGRSRQWAKTLLPDSLSHILFVGYSSDGSLSSRIKEGKKQKTITIDGKPIANRCGITNLLSFSSHINHDDLLNYYSEINTEKVALVHSDYGSKLEFAKELQEEIGKKNKTSRVICINASTELLL